MIRFGMSGLPPAEGDDGAFLDDVVARGHTAYELAFVKDFPWKRDRCARFGDLAAERGVTLSVHAPYFAVLTLDEEDRAKQSVAALEHAMKLGRALGARTIVAHTGYTKGRPPEALMEVTETNLRRLEPKVRDLGVALGLETSGTERAFGTLGDIARLAKQFSFVHPVVDWAHVHAMSGGSLTSVEAFLAVFAFLRSEFPGWMIEPLHAQFTDNEFGPKGEIRHVPYGQGSLKADLLGKAVVEAGMRMVLISEAHDAASHDRIFDDLRAGMSAARPAPVEEGRPLGSGRVGFPTELRVVAEGESHVPVGTDRPLRLSNIDKVFFPADGYSKGDLINYYAAVAPVLLPHLADRAIVMARFPDGADGGFFYEKQAPSHVPAWLPTAPIHSQHRGEPIDFVMAPDAESLMWLASMGCIEIHPWLSRVATLDRPDFAIFDLDPADGTSWEQVVDAARLAKVALDRLGLLSFSKTSGATGLHLYVPLDPVYSYRRVRKFVETVGRLLVAANPESITMEWDIPRRAGKVFVDHNQNVAGKTIASVYSVRPRPGAPVSTPILWDELGDVRPDAFTIATIWERLARYGDLFAPALAGGQRLEAAEAALGVEVEEDD